ncbi:MAG: TetR/AcrR family transcriptional regulator, partial [Mycobacterium sp.]
RPLVRDAHVRGDLRSDSDTEALLSLLLLIFPHLALAPYVRGMDPILGLDEPTPEQPALAVRRLVAVLSAAFSPLPQVHRKDLKEVNS